jgi:hypothetical protein
MTNPKYQVFISSTFEDLKVERDQVIRAVLEMGHIPVGMEMFSAGDEEQWQIIKRHIEESDYYAVILAHRYGSRAEEDLSFTRKEYEYALSKGVPCLGFIIDDKTSWPANLVDDGMDKRDLDSFKALVREKPVSFWQNAEDLHGKFSIALMKAFTARPREGWVRASSTGGAQVTGEVIRLSAENAVLRKELEEAKASADESHRSEVRAAIDQMRRVNRVLSYKYSKNGEWNKGETTLLMAFVSLSPELAVEATIDDLAGILAMNIREDLEQRWHIVALNQMKGLMADFMTLDLVHPSPKRHAVSDTNEYWSLTTFGLELLRETRKMILATSSSEPEVPEAEGEVVPDEVEADDSGATVDEAP